MGVVGVEILSSVKVVSQIGLTLGLTGLALGVEIYFKK
jgi:hypothetical protein